ncbi:MAG: PKD domain-containing protein [Saprospiraceae bacterium]|nr:PKD domain-containing protein [Saprospiraceae bacterium]
MKNPSILWHLLAAVALFQSCKAPAPEAGILASATTIKAHESITFTDASSNEPTAWTWHIPGGNIPASDQPSVTVRFDFPGTYTITLTAENESGSNVTSVTITVIPADIKIAYDGLVPGGLQGRLVGDNSNIRFARYAVANNGDVHVLARNGSYQAYAYGDMVNWLNQYGGQLNPATWIGNDGSWIVAYGDDGYVSGGIPDYVLDYMVGLTNQGQRFLRFDRDSDGHFVLLTDQKRVSWSVSGINSTFNNSLVSFAFGASNSWAAISSYDYWTSANAPGGLIAKLAELKQGNYEFVDIEIGEYGWFLVYR